MRIILWEVDGLMTVACGYISEDWLRERRKIGSLLDRVRGCLRLNVDGMNRMRDMDGLTEHALLVVNRLVSLNED